MIPFLKYLFAASVLEALNSSAYFLQEYNQLQKCLATKQLKIYHPLNKTPTEITIISLCETDIQHRSSQRWAED